MYMQPNFLLFAAIAMAAAIPALGQTPSATPAGKNAQRRTDPGLYTRMDTSRLSLVRAARLGPRPDNQLVPLGGAGASRCGRFAGFASQ